ncbi:MAG: inositol-3-phosphate synthase [Solirubrobacterales bacterium]
MSAKNGSKSESANGAARDGLRGADEVRVAVIGVGNCASSFIQGVEFYKDANPRDSIPGLMHVDLGGYHVRDVKFVAAFDIDADKVGKDLSQAIWAGQNNTMKFCDVPEMGVKVERGMTHDGLGKYLNEKIKKAPGETADIVGILKKTQADVLVSYLPVGSEDATKWYVEQALAAGCAFVNCIPVFIARERYWQKRFEDAGLPIIGDDIKSQVGATIAHRMLARLFQERGVEIMRMSQLNVGGNMDFYNMLERERLESKKISKTNAVTSILDKKFDPDDVHVGPSDYVPWLSDRKWAHIRIEGESFGGAPLNMELKLEVWDSPNSAGIVIDAVRACKLALNNGLAGALTEPSSYLMKSPPKQVPDPVARERTEEFIATYAGKGMAAAAKRAKGGSRSKPKSKKKPSART